MDIKLEEFEPNTDLSKKSVVGWVKVNLSEKMYVWLTVLRGRNGVFLKFVGIKIDEKYVPCMGWIGKNMEEVIREAIMAELKPKLIQGPLPW